MANNFKTIAKELRKRSTDAEKLLWKYLRSKQLEGLNPTSCFQINNHVISMGYASGNAYFDTTDLT